MKVNGLMIYIFLNLLNVFVRGVNIFLGIYGRKKLFRIFLRDDVFGFF